MTRWSEKYPSVASSAIDTRRCSRENAWINNLTSDYEYIYEYIIGSISNNEANAEKFNRLHERKFLTDDNKVNIMVVKDKMDNFLNKIPCIPQEIIEKFSTLTVFIF